LNGNIFDVCFGRDKSNDEQVQQKNQLTDRGPYQEFAWQQPDDKELSATNNDDDDAEMKA